MSPISETCIADYIVYYTSRAGERKAVGELAFARGNVQKLERHFNLYQCKVDQPLTSCSSREPPIRLREVLSCHLMRQYVKKKETCYLSKETYFISKETY